MVVRIGHLLTQPGSIPAVPHRTGRLFFLGSWLVFLPLRSLWRVPRPSAVIEVRSLTRTSPGPGVASLPPSLKLTLVECS